MEHNTYEEAKEAGIASLQAASARKLTSTIIRLDGVAITLDSKECVWRKPADAKLALRHHLNFHLRDKSWEIRRDWVTRFLEEMQANGRLEFVPFESKGTDNND